MSRSNSRSNTDFFFGPRDAALWALIRIARDGAYLDKLISDLHRRAGKDPRDQNLAEAIVKGALENQEALENLLRPLVDKFDRSAPELRSALFIGAAQLKVLSAIPNHAAVSETVDAARRVLGAARAGLVNAVLRKISSSPDPLPKISALPAWVNARFTVQYGEQSAELLEALEHPLPVFVRINPLRTTLEQCIAEFAAEGVTANRFDHIPLILALNLDGVRIPDKLFTKGICTVQDPSASLASLALNPQSGERVLDLCAAPGGKSTHIAEMMGDQGLVQAQDINEQKLKLVWQHAHRLGLRAVQVRQQDATLPSEPDQVYDRVLLDAPCSGTGVLARKRDALSKKREQDLERLIELQRKLLSNAVRQVRASGGVLVYSTCSLDFAENEHQIAWFLDNFSDFKLVKAHPRVPETFVTEQGYIKAMPHKHGCAGGFAAVLTHV